MTTLPSPNPTSPSQAPATSPRTLERADLVPLVLLVGILIGLLWKVLFTPAMLFYRDVYNYTYPTARFIQETCRQGFLPYWNPYLNYGQPILANPNLLFFYPYTLLIVLLPIDLAYSLHYVVHFALAGIGTYFLARRWGQSRMAAFFAASIFAFSGPLLSLGNLYNHAACVAWIPWALLITDRVVEEGSVRPWILLTLVFSMQFLAGEPFTLIATFALALAYGFYRCGTRRPLWAAPNLRILLGFFLVGCLMVALAAVQFLPATNLLEQSRRGTQGLRFKETVTWSFHPLSLMEMVVPDFYGPALASPTAWSRVVGDGMPPYFISVFVGFVPLFFAMAGWALGEDRRRSFVAAAALILLLLSFGHFTPLFSLAYLLVPLLALVRFPLKLLIPVLMLTAILAGWGLDALRRESQCWKKERHRILLPLGCLLACIVALWGLSWLVPKLLTSGMAWLLGASGHAAPEAKQMAAHVLTMFHYHLPGLVGFALGGWLLVLGLDQQRAWARRGLLAFALLGLAQLVQVNYAANPTVPKIFYTYRPPVLSELKGLPGSFRVMSLIRYSSGPADTSDVQSYVNFQSIPEIAALSSVAQGAFQQRLRLATGSMLIPVEGGLNVDIERSLPPYLYDAWIYMVLQVPRQSDCLLGRTNVKYVIGPERRDSRETRLIGEIFNGSPKPSYLYEDLCMVPRAYVAGSSLFTINSLETLRRLASPDFDALNEVILAADPGTAPAVNNSGWVGRVEILERHPNEVKLRTELSRPGYVVLLDRYDPNWHATIDGREVPVLRANQLFRAVYADAGNHEVRFFYRQYGLRLGLAVSLATLVFLAWLYWRNPFVSLR